VTYFNRYYRDRKELVEPWKFPLYVYHKIAKETWRNCYIHDFFDTESELDRRALLITHITPFYRDPERYDPRPGRWSKVENARLLNEFGFSVDVYDIVDTEKYPDDLSKYDLIMGKGLKFEQCAREASDDCLVVLYATGMPQKQVAESYRERIEALEDRKGVDFTAERPALLSEESEEMLADVIISMADNYTADLFREYYPDKPVYNVPMTHPPGFEADLETKMYDEARKNFLWFCGTGAVLKGLDRVLDVFDNREDTQLYVCGPIRNNPDFFELYEEVIYTNDNITPIGWTDIRSPRFTRLADKCGYLLYPSATEGWSGAVAACRWRGVVPILTKEVIAETDDWGVTLSDASISTIADAVETYSQIAPEELESMTRANYDAAREQYSQHRYTQQLTEVFTEIL
jgi:glycosyltransferase involved in cell wall biosynthesis